MEVVSEPLHTLGKPILEYADLDDPLIWKRNGFTMVGYGRRLIFPFNGADRTRYVEELWSVLQNAASIRDTANLLGSGLTAFTSFTFSPASSHHSLLILPEFLIGEVSGQYFQTSLTLSGLNFSEPAPETHSPVSEDAQHDEQLANKFLKNVVRANEHIVQQYFEKVVLARKIQLDVPAGFSMLTALKFLEHDYEDCWIFNIQGLFGASPETLLEIRDKTFSLQILAGSAPRGETATEDANNCEALMTSEKNLFEHQLAVDSGVDALKDLSEVLHSGQHFASAFPNLWHLATDIHGELNADSTAFEALMALHPTAAVAGTPRQAALEFIEEHEGFDRGRYAGPIGWINSHGDGQWAIALRCAEKIGNHVVAFAGCGIVAGSVPEDELQETVLKFAPIRQSVQAGLQ